MKRIFATLLLALLLFQVFAQDRNNKPHRVVCYWGSWSADNWRNSKDLNPNVCTHVIYAFARLVNNTIQVWDENRDGGEVIDHSKGRGMIRRMNELKKYNPYLTTLISIGGWGEGSTKYSELVRSAANRKKFVQSVVQFLKDYNLDGLDFDWEFPASSGVDSGDRTSGRDEDKQDFVTLLKELKEAFEPNLYVLTAAVATSKYQVDRAYDIAGLSKYLDFINLMTYEFHGAWDHRTGHGAALYPDPSASEVDQMLTVKYAVEYWLQRGANPKKLVMGIPLFGYWYKLASKDNARVGAPISSAHEGESYSKMCQLVKQPGWHVHWDNQSQVPYAVKGDEWISYDNLRSVHKKLEYLLEKRLGGSMVWAVNGDDWKGSCGDGRYPMMKLQMKVLNNLDVIDVRIPTPNNAPDYEL